ncbi:MAG TPA: YqgE/AlgH family protein [Thermoanaerobaculia bacterium]|nr:YqgE/AlgH family protein [Thermoanaerobaculia bacterium]
MFIDSLEAPVLLIAMHQVVDPYFHRSVVLLLEHSSEGSFGVIINRPLELKVDGVLDELGISWNGGSNELIHFGGPVQPEAGITLFSRPDPIDLPDAREVAPGLQFANDSDTLKALASQPPSQFRLLVGYAGWSAGQLEGELTRNDWLLAPFDAGLVFAADPAAVWNRALSSIGVRPEALPSWTVPDDSRGN